jgi:hypothetical protein
LKLSSHCNNFVFFRNEFLFCVSSPTVKVFKLTGGVFDEAPPEVFMEITNDTLHVAELKPEEVYPTPSLTDALLIKTDSEIHICDITNLWEKKVVKKTTLVSDATQPPFTIVGHSFEGGIFIAGEQKNIIEEWDL